jgi:hypothetical protein
MTAMRMRREAYGEAGRARWVATFALAAALACSVATFRAPRAAAGPAAAADIAPATADERVERARVSSPDPPALSFLTTHRDFFRTQLELLRRIAKARDGAEWLDPRAVRYHELLVEIERDRAAHRAPRARFDGDSLLAHVSELVRLECEIAAAESALARQEGRLAELARNAREDQRTAILVTFGCDAGAAAPRAVELLEGGDVRARIRFDDVERDALVRGGAAELSRHLAEPREHVLIIRALDDSGAEVATTELRLTPEPDRMTVVEVAAAPSAGESAAFLVARAWTR